MDFNEYRPDQSFEEPDEHADEKWLVSYADMMTLLFGLFVLLFSMSKMDSSAIEKIKQGTSEHFGSKRVLEPGTINLSKDELLNRLEEQETELIGLRGSAQTLEDENSTLRNSLEKIQSELKETVEIPALAPDASLTSEIAELKKRLHLVTQKNLRLEKSLKETSTSDAPEDLQDQIKELENQLASKSSATESAAAKIAKYRVYLKKLNDSRKSLKNENIALTGELHDAKQAAAQVLVLERKLASADQASAAVAGLNEKLKLALDAEARLKVEAQNLAKVNTELKEKIRLDEIQRAGDLEKKSFLAFMINWSSKDHDIDLVIEDPKGQKFDFKKRVVAGHPGKFALDTRRGPGAEIWQTDQPIPGRYKATYFFFNQYGNISPAQVNATLFTPKGSIELKPVELDLTTSRSFQVIFDIDKEGQVKVVKN